MIMRYEDMTGRSLLELYRHESTAIQEKEKILKLYIGKLKDNCVTERDFNRLLIEKVNKILEEWGVKEVIFYDEVLGCTDIKLFEGIYLMFCNVGLGADWYRFYLSLAKQVRGNLHIELKKCYTLVRELNEEYAELRLAFNASKVIRRD